MADFPFFDVSVRQHFAGAIKGPYNVDDRRKAGMTPDFYEDLTGELGHIPPVVTAPIPPVASVAAVPVGYQP